MQLSEKDFIHESKPSQGWKVWLGLGLIAACFIFFVFSAKWVVEQTNVKIEAAPFLQVTNREFSLFLWQNPEFMRSNRKKKAGYLSGFHTHPKVTPIPEQADDWVAAPPDILFLYHCWNRLLSNERVLRPVPVSEFREFLDDAKEWQPVHWSAAPQEYVELVSRLSRMEADNIGDQLPQPVLRAFIGWKNYFKEGDEINHAVHSSVQIESFLKAHPNYAPNYWRPFYPDYLRSLDGSISEVVPGSEIPSFLKAALYNSSV